MVDHRIKIVRDHNLFAKVHRLIGLDSSERWFATTTIHFIRKPADGLNILPNLFSFRQGSDNFHWAVLERGCAAIIWRSVSYAAAQKGISN